MSSRVDSYPIRSILAALMALAVLLLAPSSKVWAGQDCRLVDKQTGKPFRVFEIINYRNKPDLHSFCIEPLKIWYSREFWPDGAPRKRDFDMGLPERHHVELAAQRSPGFGNITVLDIEHWPVEHRFLASAAVENYIAVLDWFRKAAPTEQAVGYYSMVPIRDYWRAIKGVQHKDYAGWRKENDRLRPLADAVDIIFPSLYTFYEDSEGWLTYAEAQINESRRIAPNKPVYAFLWPVYHPTNDWRSGDPVEPDYWRMQLELVRQHADGLVIWTSSSTKSVDFGDIPPWWHESVQFVSQNFDCEGCP